MSLFSDNSGTQTPIGRTLTPEPDLNSSWNLDTTNDDEYGEEDTLGDSMVRIACFFVLCISPFR